MNPVPTQLRNGTPPNVLAASALPPSDELNSYSTSDDLTFPSEPVALRSATFSSFTSSQVRRTPSSEVASHNSERAPRSGDRKNGAPRVVPRVAPRKTEDVRRTRLGPVVTQRLLIVTASALMVLSAACSASAPARHAAEAAADRASPVVMHRLPVAASGDITLAFAGDMHFAGRVARLLEDPATTFGPITSVLKSADFTAVNLETPVTRRGQPQPKTYHFATTRGAFIALGDAGVDLVTMANNHILDYGQTGLADTLAAAKAARFPVVGAGVNATAAWAPYVTAINGTKIAIVGVSQVAELASSWVATAYRPGEANAINLGQTLAAVRAAKRLARIVIVFMHWGTEGMACPDHNQLSLAPKLAAAGASIIIGAHAHVLQGSGWLGHTFVAYASATSCGGRTPTARPPGC